MNTIKTFKENEKFTMGIELELQLINFYTWNLVMESSDLLRRIEKTEYQNLIKPEITESMIEINSSIHDNYQSLIQELCGIRETLIEHSRVNNIGICRGGAHPFQKWKEQKIFKTDRFLSVSEQYGYLAKQFTVFGQHIHISCRNGDEAL
ncbi:MAG: glutamate-cysteine ligase family protein [Gammaproteobacteria bacterium]